MYRHIRCRQKQRSGQLQYRSIIRRRRRNRRPRIGTPDVDEVDNLSILTLDADGADNLGIYTPDADADKRVDNLDICS